MNKPDDASAVDLKTALMLEAINGIIASAIRNPSKP